MNEAKITVNGKNLNEAQSMTIRNAIESFSASLNNQGLGEDEHSRKTTSLYQARISEIRNLFFE